MHKNILIIRHVYRGDVLLCSAIVRALKYRNPKSNIHFQTKFPDVFRNNPDVLEAGPMAGISYPEDMDVVLDLNNVLYSRYAGHHLIDAFAHPCGFDIGECRHTTSFYPDAADVREAETTLPDNLVVIAPGPGQWTGRNWTEEGWNWVIRKLMSKGYKVAIVGMELNYVLYHTHDLRQHTHTFSQLAAVIGRARLFIGIDSFPCHIAGAMKTPRVVLFGVTKPELILCDAPKTLAVTADQSHPFYGRRHGTQSMVQIEPFMADPANNPMLTIQPEAVLEAALKLL